MVAFSRALLAALGTGMTGLRSVLPRTARISSMSLAGLSWRIVLVRPRNPLNIGAAARAMANFGFRDLVVAKPYEPTWQETRSAVGAEDVVTSAHAVPTLLEATGDAALVIGTTSGTRRHLKRDLVQLGDLPG